MKSALFLHATLNVKNMLGNPSLLLEKINSSQTALEYLTENLSKSCLVDAFYLVTSDKPCDDEIERIAKNNTWEVIRIPTGFNYSLEESNCIINNQFTFKTPVYGFYTSEYCLEFSKKQRIDLVTTLLADNCILLKADLLDDILKRCKNKGDLFGAGTPHAPIITVPVKELEALHIQQKAELKKQFQHIMRTVEDDEEFLMKEHSISIDKTAKIKNIEKNFNRPVYIPLLLGTRNMKEGIIKKGLSEVFPGKEMQLHPLFTDKDLDVIKECVRSSEELSLENFFEKEHSFDAASANNYPGYMEIEITSRCDLKCKNCPQTVLKRKKQDLDAKSYKKIIDDFAGKVPMLCLSGFGEPLLHEKAVDFIRYAKEKGFLATALETNGSLLDEEKISWFHTKSAY